MSWDLASEEPRRHWHSALLVAQVGPGWPAWEDTARGPGHREAGPPGPPWRPAPARQPRPETPPMSNPFETTDSPFLKRRHLQDGEGPGRIPSFQPVLQIPRRVTQRR